jgi:hypothetical protein
VVGVVSYNHPGLELKKKIFLTAISVNGGFDFDLLPFEGA